MSMLTKDLTHHIQISQSHDDLFAGEQLVLRVCLSDCADGLVDVLDALDPFLQTWKAQQRCSNLESVFALDLAEHLKGVVSPPNRINEHVDHHLEHRGLEGILLARSEYQLVLVGICSFLVDIAKHLQQRFRHLLDIAACELLVPHWLSLAQEGTQGYQVGE